LSRIILEGTERKYKKPSRQQLALPDWDNSKLHYADLTGKTIPPMRDADVFHYLVDSGTVFGDTDWTQFRFPDSYTAQWAENLSSYNHDGVVTVLRQAGSDPGWNLVADHVGTDYTHSWQDSMWRLRTELGMSNEDIWQSFQVAFAGYPSLLSRLKAHCDNDMVQPTPPDTETNSLQLMVDGQPVDISLAGIKPVGFDRYAMEEPFKIAMGMRAGSALIRVHIAQTDPHLVAFAVTDDSVSPEYKAWWQDRWGRG
jgi:hypothetical protein